MYELMAGFALQEQLGSWTFDPPLGAIGYLLDPHTAAAMHVATARAGTATPMVVLATAHPAKFPAAVGKPRGLRRNSRRGLMG